MDEMNLSNEMTSQIEEDGTAAMTDTDAAAPEQEKQEKQERTFTQAELDAIVQKRIVEVKQKAEQRNKMTADERIAEIERREQELVQKEIKATAKTMFQDKQLPEELADIIPFNSKEELPIQIEAIREAIYKWSAARPVKLRGAVPGSFSGTQTESLDAVGESFRRGLNS